MIFSYDDKTLRLKEGYFEYTLLYKKENWQKEEKRYTELDLLFI